MVGRKQALARPAFLNDGDEFLSDVEAAGILPAILKPALQSFRRILVEHVDVEFPLGGEDFPERGHGQRGI